MSAAVWSLADECYVSVPATPGRAWDDREAIIRSGRRLAGVLEVREVEVPRCANGGHLLEADGATCDACAADDVARQAQRELDEAEETIESLRDQIAELQVALKIPVTV